MAFTLCSCGQQQGSDADTATAGTDVVATTDAATHDAATPSDVSTQNDTAARAADTFAPPCTCDNAKDTVCQRNRCDATGQCVMTPVVAGTPCEDGDPCSIGDTCQAGACKAGATNACACKADKDCPDDGDLCNGTTYCDTELFPWRCRLNTSSIVTCAPTNSACQTAACDTATGKCAVTNQPDGLACKDADPCTSDDACANGACVGVQTCVCKTTADCANDDDGNPCNGTLYCASDTGKCSLNPATVVQCNAAADAACVKNQCAAATGLCTLQAAPPSTACEDGEPCTKGDHCAGGECVTGTNTCLCESNADCASKDDGDKCNGIKFCDKSDSTCKFNPASVVSCQTVNDTACAVAVCMPSQGTCTQLARKDVIADCTAAAGSAKSCHWRLKKPGEQGDPGPFGCDDGDTCTSGDVCEGTTCKPAAVTCKCKSNADCIDSDGDVCTGTDYCDKSLAVPACVFNPASKVFCSKKDDTDCLAAQCDSKTGQCGLQPAKAGTSCDDGKPCTKTTHCDAVGGCAGGSAVVCDDSKACTVDACDAKTGCTHTLRTCADGNSCTADVCEAKTGQCVFTKAADGAVCNADGNGCTVNDTCAAGVCLVGKPLQCAGQTAACQELECQSTGPLEFKCVAVPLADGTDCDDGKGCVGGHTCNKGGCVTAANARTFVKSFGANLGYEDLRAVAVLGDGSILIGGARRTKQADKPDANVAHARVLSRFGDAIKEFAPDPQKGHADAGYFGFAPAFDGTFYAGVNAFDGTAVRARLERRKDDGTLVWTAVQAVPKYGTRGTHLDRRLTGELAMGVELTLPDKSHAGIAMLRLKANGTELSSAVIARTGAWLQSLAFLADGRIATSGFSVINGAGWSAVYQAIDVVDATGAAVWSFGLGTGQGEHEAMLLRPLAGGASSFMFAQTVSGKHKRWVRHYNAAGEQLVEHDLPPGLHMRAAVPIGDAGSALLGDTDDAGTKKDLLLAAVGGGGDPHWTRKLDTGGADHATGIAALADGGYVIVGRAVFADHTAGTVWRTSAFGHHICGPIGKCDGKQTAACDDGKPCTRDDCDATLGCTHAPDPAFWCDPKDGCATSGGCQSGSCTPDHNGRLFAAISEIGNTFWPRSIVTLNETPKGYEMLSLHEKAGKQSVHRVTYDNKLRFTKLEDGLPTCGVPISDTLRGHRAADGSYVFGSTVPSGSSKSARFCRSGDASLNVARDGYEAIDIRHGPGPLTYLVGRRVSDGGYLLEGATQGSKVLWAGFSRGSTNHHAAGLAVDVFGDVLVVGALGAGDTALGTADARDTKGAVLFSKQLAAKGVVLGAGAGRGATGWVVAGTQHANSFVSTSFIAALGKTGTTLWTYVPASPDHTDITAVLVRKDGTIVGRGGAGSGDKRRPIFVGLHPGGAEMFRAQAEHPIGNPFTPARDAFFEHSSGALVSGAIGRWTSGPSNTVPGLVYANAWGQSSCAHAGKCAPLANDACDDKNACTTDWCAPEKGCSHAAITGCK